MFPHFQQCGKPQCCCKQRPYNFLNKIEHPTNSTQNRTPKEADISPAGHEISRLLYGQRLNNNNNNNNNNNSNNNKNFMNCKWVDTRWQWSFKMLHMYGLFALNLVVGRGATWEACSGNLEHKREPSQHLL